ncbi:MAG: DUF1523 family protein [Paracoccus sp. (in: a-proteobacteria)]|nr:DUF1523 family protein [Paracoccus sp. (in: a-proteobacteria)]
MRNLQIFLGVLLGVAVFAFLDYALPSRETVRITNTYNRLTPVTARNAIFFASEDTGTVQHSSGQRDVRYIDTVRPNGRVRVYRNEDTGWVWPPYFKYDSSNLHARATDLQSSSGAPQWVSVTSYGWRIPWLTAYPNAVSINPVVTADERPLNWPALAVLVALGLFLALLWRLWNRFQRRTLGPLAERVDARGDAVRGRARGWWDRMRGR